MVTRTRARRRYQLFAGLVAAIGVLGIVLLASIVVRRPFGEPVPVRLSSPRVRSLHEVPRPGQGFTMAVIPAGDARDAYSPWYELAEILGAALARPVNLVQRRGYRDVNDLLERGEIDLGQVGAGAYVTLERLGAVRLLAVPRVRGREQCESVLVVPAASARQGLEDLRGADMAFTDPLSVAGWLYPAFLLHGQGESIDAYYARTTFTHGDERSLLGVAGGIVDAAAVSSVAYEDMAARRPDVIRRLRVIHRSPPFGTDPIVIPTRLAGEEEARLRAAFLGLDGDPAAGPVLSRLGIEAYVAGDPEGYRSVGAMLDALDEGD